MAFLVEVSEGKGGVIISLPREAEIEATGWDRSCPRALQKLPVPLSTADRAYHMAGVHRLRSDAPKLEVTAAGPRTSPLWKRMTARCGRALPAGPSSLRSPKHSSGPARRRLTEPCPYLARPSSGSLLTCLLCSPPSPSPRSRLVPSSSQAPPPRKPLSEPLPG